MKRRYFVLPMMLLAGIVGGLTLSTPASASGGVQLGTGLTGARINGVRPQGHCYYHSNNGQSQFDISVENVDLADGTTLNVNDNGTAFTTIVLTGGQSIWRLRTTLGDVIPAMMAGDVISITDSSNNTILSGTLRAPVASFHLVGTLTGATLGNETPVGAATYSSTTTRQQFKLKVSSVNLIDGTALTVNDNGVSFGTMTLKKGKAKLSLDSNKGDDIPVMQDGDVITVTLANGNVVLAGEMGQPVHKHHIIALNARLTGPAIGNVTPFGYAHYELNLNNNAMHFGSGAYNVNLADGTVVNFNWNGNTIGTLTLRSGRVFFRLDTSDGDSVPTMQVGDVITITDSNGNVFLSGTLSS